MIEFTVPGEPVPQPRPRVSTVGGFARAYVPKSHPVHAYRQAIALAARAAGLSGLSASDVPLHVEIYATFARPASHLDAKGRQKATAKKLPRPDCDNIAKAVLDSLQDFFDDSLVARLVVAKSYGQQSSTRVVIE